MVSSGTREEQFETATGPIAATRAGEAGASPETPPASAGPRSRRDLRCLLPRLRSALHRRGTFALDSLRSRLRSPRRRILFANHDGREQEIRAALRWTRHDVTFGELTPDTIAGADVVIPLDTPDLLRLDELRDELGPQPIPVPTRRSVELCDDKPALLEHLRASGFEANLPGPRRGDEFPYVLKLRQGYGSHGVWIVPDAETEARLLAEVGERDHYSERFLAGTDEYVTHALCRDGRIVFAQDLRMRFDRADGVKNRDRILACEPIPCRHVELFERMLAAAEFEGICCFNYKLEQDRPIVFEINPRVGASLAPLFHRVLRFL